MSRLRLMEGQCTIRQASEASGLSPDTIRYYERVGVLPRVGRGPNRYRGYTAEHIETLRFARRLRELGIPPASMAALIRVFHDGSCRELRDELLISSRAALETLRARREELERMEAQLRAIVDGLQELDPDDHRLLTLDPCGCVEIVEREGP